MAVKSQRPKGRDGALSLLNVAIDALNLAKEVSSITPAKAAFGTVSILLTMIKDSVVNELDYVELGLSCADICRALDRGMNGKKLEDLNQSVCDAINQLTRTVAEIQQEVIKKSGRHKLSRFLRSRNDKDTITAWRSDLNRILNVFNTELTMNTHTIVADVHQNVLKIREDVACQNRVISAAGESPPPPPGIFFGRGELIEKIVGCAERLRPIALIGAGGIGKTSAALTVLHDDRIKQRFGDNRWFIRCDEFSASRANSLRRLSKVIGAGIENPEDLAPLRPFLSSNEMVIVLDNAESILGVQGTSGQEIYTIVDELSRFNKILVCITSQISTIPSHCETFDIPTLSKEAACDTFHRIHTHGGHSDLVDDVLEQLDFHPLSITLLATVSRHNKWDTHRLTREWERRRTGVLDARHSGSLAATIELSLSSPMFQERGSDARELLGVVAFFPQVVDEKNLDWLFPTIPDGASVFDGFCTLSLTHRSHGFITMLAPLRDYFCPEDPRSSPLLVTTKECYFTRLSTNLDPNTSSFGEARWIISEDVNVEHLLDVFTSIDADSKDVWDTCENFMCHLHWHKPRHVALGPKIEELPDTHPSKAPCLRGLSRLFHFVGNLEEGKRLLTHALKLWRGWGYDNKVAETLRSLSNVNRRMELYEEGIRQAKEASETFARLDDPVGQARSLIDLALLLCSDRQLDAAEGAASHAINLLSEKGEQFKVCLCHRVLGKIYHFKGDTEKASHHFEVALGIASSFDWPDQLFWIHHHLACLFFDQGRFDDAYAHIECAKSHAVNAYYLARAMKQQATFWCDQRKLEESKSEALHAVEVFEKLGATRDVEECRKLLQRINEETNSPIFSDEPGDDDSWVTASE